MKYKDLKIDRQKVVLNDYQTIYIQYEQIKNIAAQVQFPIIIVDTEFFNRSHDRDNLEPKLYDEHNKDVIYLINYSFAKSFKEIQVRNNFKCINHLSIKRQANDLKYNFKTQHHAMMVSFITMCLNKNIRSIIFAGQDNDKKIFETWINEHKVLLHNKKSELFVFNKLTHSYALNSLDIYDVLEKNLCFANFNEHGDKFYNEQNLKPGKIEGTIALRSLKKFFDYTRSLHEYLNLKDDDIAFLCTKALRLFTLPSVNATEHEQLTQYVKQVKTHCYDDVLKILIWIKFMGYVIEKGCV